MLRTMLPSISIAAAGFGHGFAPANRSGVLAPNNLFCLMQRETATVNCMFATMQQCRRRQMSGAKVSALQTPLLAHRITIRATDVVWKYLRRAL